MSRFFNTTGPCNPQDHYMLSPKERLVNAPIAQYLEKKLYWVLHAPRQSGKTTFLQSWMKEINSGDQAIACYVSVERCQQFPTAHDSMPAICSAIRDYASDFLAPEYIPAIPQENPASILGLILKNWAKLVAPKALVVLFDEVDVLEDQAMVSFLRQLRGGFASRGIGIFPTSIVLVGMRDLRDYLIKSKDGAAINPGSPFNIKQNSATLSNFTRSDVHLLIDQHITETGQVFESEAIDCVYDLTRGQPWLTNALCQKCVWYICTQGETVTVSHIHKAKEMLIQERAVHLDSLAERLKDQRIKHIVEVILTGDIDPQMAQTDDFRLSQDLGIVTVEDGTPIISNPIYQEIIPRVLSYGMQIAIPKPEFTWQKKDGTLDMHVLLAEFQKFWARHSDIWEQKADYTEAFPHLLLMAFLQRVINSGGTIDREYAAGRGRVDLVVGYAHKVYIIETKIVRTDYDRDNSFNEGLIQIAKYRDTIDPHAESYLVLFDRTVEGRKKTWKERLTWVIEKDHCGRDVVVIGA